MAKTQHRVTSAIRRCHKVPAEALRWTPRVHRFNTAGTMIIPIAQTEKKEPSEIKILPRVIWLRGGRAGLIPGSDLNVWVSFFTTTQRTGLQVRREQGGRRMGFRKGLAELETTSWALKDDKPQTE